MDISIVKKVWQVVNAGSNGMPDGVGCLYLVKVELKGGRSELEGEVKCDNLRQKEVWKWVEDVLLGTGGFAGQFEWMGSWMCEW